MPFIALGAVIFIVSELLIPLTLESCMVSMYFELRAVVSLIIRVSSIFFTVSILIKLLLTELVLMESAITIGAIFLLVSSF
jgi:hypothetical protein